jgi:iron(III) transport system substrate-binding protein
MKIRRFFTTCVFFAVIASIVCASASLSAEQKEVVVYTALDQVFSEPILQDFEKETGIRVKAVYDIEATKTIGLVNRLMAEKSNPQCDVFWNNEVIKSIILKRKGVLAPYHSPSAKDIPDHFKDLQGYWTGFAARARVLVVNSSLLSNDDYPRSIFDLTDPKWRGRIGIANPLFGTTATHVAALFTYLGEDKAGQFFKDLKANRVQVVDGNSVVKDRAGAGMIKAGFTDTDDVSTGILAGMPIKAVFPDKSGMGTLLIPNTVCLVADCPHPQSARQLIDYLLSRKVEQQLAFSPSVQMPVRAGVKTPDNFISYGDIKSMQVDYEAVADVMEDSVKYVQQLLIR